MTEANPRGGANAYARAIERCWGGLLERPVVLSPKDWSLIIDWHSRGVPLALVLETLADLNHRRPPRRAPRSLSYVAAAVEEAWRVVVEGRSHHGISESSEAEVDPVACWRRRALIEPTGSGLRSMLERLLEAQRSGAPSEELDASLEGQIESCVAEELLGSVRERVEAELAPFHERIGAEALDRTRRAAVVARLRQALGLPRLRVGR